MLREPTMEKLYAMRLAVMAAAWEEQEKDPKLRGLEFGERFGLLVDAEHRARDNRRLTRLLKQAELRISEACIEDLKTGPGRGLPIATVRQLATGAWIGEHLNVLISGATGVGKSYLACALGQMTQHSNPNRVLRQRSIRSLQFRGAPGWPTGASAALGSRDSR